MDRVAFRAEPMTEMSRIWRPDGPLALAETLAVHRRGQPDPTHHVSGDGAVWRTCRTPDGPVTMRLVARAAEAEVEASAWGPGAEWALDAVPRLLGSGDRPDEFEPRHPLLERAVREQRGLRIGASGLIMDALVPSILEQKVTGKEAWRSWRALLARYGDPAPGPGAGYSSGELPAKLTVLPAAEVIRRIPSWEWHRMGVGPQRAETLVRAARVVNRLEEAAAMPAGDASARLQAVPGIGQWTAAEVIQRALGDPDAVSVGDFHIPSVVAYNLAGERTADDDRMLELLEPYRGQRYRACLLIERSGRRPPRRGPRMPIRDFRRM